MAETCNFAATHRVRSRADWHAEHGAHGVPTDNLSPTQLKSEREVFTVRVLGCPCGDQLVYMIEGQTNAPAEPWPPAMPEGAAECGVE